MYQPPSKPVREEWRWFNEAVERRAAYLTHLVVPRARLAPPAPPADWLRRGAGIAVVVLAVGLATALVLWALAPPLNRTSEARAGVPSAIRAIPAPQSSDPKARVVVDFTRFTSVTMGDLEVVTGWKYGNSEQVRPKHQYCYVRSKRLSAALTTVDIHIASSALGVRSYDEAAMAPLTRSEY